jgi:hypothetical protein
MPYPLCLSRSRPARRRGCCLRCYRQLAYRVAAGEASWAELEQVGVCLAAGRSPWYDGRRWLRMRLPGEPTPSPKGIR